MGKPTGEHRHEVIIVKFHRHRDSLSSSAAIEKVDRWIARQIVRGFNRLRIHVDSVSIFNTYHYDHGKFLGDQFEWEGRDD